MNFDNKTEVEGEKKLAAPQGLYIPPARMQMYLEQMDTDKSSESYQRLAWDTMKKSINGLINKVNVANISFVAQEIFQENLVRARGILCYYIMRAQVASPLYTHIYASLMSVVNSKFPRNGELLLRRLVIQFKRAFKRNDKTVSMNSSKFIAHLVNQNVAHELLALEILTLLLQNPTPDSIEVCVSFLKEVGAKLEKIAPKAAMAVFERLRKLLLDSEIEIRIQHIIEVIFVIRKDCYKDFPIMIDELDLIMEDDQMTHFIRLDDNGSTEDILNVFKYDPNYEQNEEKYKAIKREILDDDSESEDELLPEKIDKFFTNENDDDENEEENQSEEDVTEEKKDGIIDKTETENIALRRMIYLVIQSSLNFEECAHKLSKMQIRPDQEYEFCAMIIDCCMQQRTYEKFYGQLTQRFCLLKPDYMEKFMELFKDHYETCHRLDTVKLSNVAKLYAHLLFHDAILWTILDCVNINEDDTTSSNRIFLRVLFQELNQFMGMDSLKERLLKEDELIPYFQGIFPKDNPKNTRFAINFFTAIGLGQLTEELRHFLKQAPKQPSTIKSDDPGPTPVHPLLVQAARAAQASKNLKQKDVLSENNDDSSSSSSSDHKRRSKNRSRSKRLDSKPSRTKHSSSSSVRKGRRRFDSERSSSERLHSKRSRHRHSGAKRRRSRSGSQRSRRLRVD